MLAMSLPHQGEHQLRGMHARTYRYTPPGGSYLDIRTWPPKVSCPYPYRTVPRRLFVASLVVAGPFGGGQGGAGYLASRWAAWWRYVQAPQPSQPTGGSSSELA